MKSEIINTWYLAPDDDVVLPPILTTFLFSTIDEKTGTSVSSPSSLASDFDVWSPRVKEEDVAILEAHGGEFKIFLTVLSQLLLC